MRTYIREQLLLIRPHVQLTSEVYHRRTHRGWLPHWWTQTRSIHPLVCDLGVPYVSSVIVGNRPPPRSTGRTPWTSDYVKSVEHGVSLNVIPLLLTYSTCDVIQFSTTVPDSTRNTANGDSVCDVASEVRVPVLTNRRACESSTSADTTTHRLLRTAMMKWSS